MADVRLIDTTPIVKFIENGMNNPNRAEAFGSDATEILAEIMIAPTINPEDCRPQGRWIHTAIEDDECWGGTFHRWTCSNCDFSTGHNPNGTNYCPNCGADMRGKEQGE